MTKFNALIPELTVSDIAKIKAFYIDLLGFTLEYEREEDGFVFLSFQGSQLMFEQYGNDGWHTADLAYPYGRGVNFEIGVADVESLYLHITKAGITPFRPLKTNTYRQGAHSISQMEFLIQDPDGYLLRFVEG